MKIELAGCTVFTVPESVPWYPLPERDFIRSDPDDPALFYGEDLIEFSGRACYQSWNRPNPITATNEGYLEHIIEVGHWSVLEHASASFYITGVSRSLTHELVRHRHLSYSQLSQRYVDSSTAQPILPPEFADDEDFVSEVHDAYQVSQVAYDELVATATAILKERGELANIRKRARQAARCVLPNMTETKIVVTGNYRAWAHFIHLRATLAADHEIRALAIEILRQLQKLSPHVFNHWEIRTEDNTEIAEGPAV